MNHFIYRVFKIIFFPVILAIIAGIIWDPFRVFFTYDDYYTGNIITGNREHICFKLLEKRKKKPTSFIIGSSRRLAYKTSYWATKLSEPPEDCFHYDASAMGIYRGANAIRHIDEQTAEIKNLLLIVDTEFFNEVSNPQGYLFTQHYDVSGGSILFYYLAFIRGSINPNFIFSNIIYNFSGNYYNFMGDYINKSKNSHVINDYSADFSFSYEEDIKLDSLAFYNNLMEREIFYKRDTVQIISKKTIYKEQIEYLQEIKKILEKNNTRIRIVISPLYNQILFNRDDLNILIKMFGENSVFDFSGINYFTEDFTNYYETSHYKPYVANRIMDILY